LSFFSRVRSIRRLLDIATTPDGSSDSRDTETVRRIARELSRLPPEEARRVAAYAYVLARVAHADREVSERELTEMQERVERFGELAPAQAALVVALARQRAAALGSTEDYLVTRQYREISTREERLALLSCLYAVAAADESVSQIEDAQIGQIANELGLIHEELARARATVREKLSVLRG
jgi:uncharacterized tellurite resistance protein B-like protein